MFQRPVFRWLGIATFHTATQTFSVVSDYQIITKPLTSALSLAGALTWFFNEDVVEMSTRSKSDQDPATIRCCQLGVFE